MTPLTFLLCICLFVCGSYCCPFEEIKNARYKGADIVQQFTDYPQLKRVLIYEVDGTPCLLFRSKIQTLMQLQCDDLHLNEWIIVDKLPDILNNNYYISQAEMYKLDELTM